MTVILVLSLLGVLLAACGTDAASDPFVGTWNDRDGSFPVVIGKTVDGYDVTYFMGTFRHAERHGDRIRAWVDLVSDGKPTGTTVEMILTLVPATGHLILTDPSASGVRFELERASDSTAIPSPWPSGG